MRYLVTGSAGFIGARFVQMALEADEKNMVVGIDCLYDCSTTTMAYSKDRYVFVKASINEKGRVLNLIQEYNVDIVVHFAAQSHVDTSFSTPDKYVTDNIKGTFSILKALRTVNQERIVPLLMISTDEVYGENKNEESHSETSLLMPSSVYAASKASAEMLCHAYSASKHVPIKTIRGNNCFGRQYPEKLIPRFIRLITENKAITIQGNGKQRRSFLYVDDFCDAVFTVIEKGQNGAVYNIASTDELNIFEVANVLKEELQIEDELKIEYIKDRDFNDKRYLIHSGELEKLGWKQKTSFREGIRKTIAFFQSPEAKDYWVKDYVLSTQSLSDDHATANDGCCQQPTTTEERSCKKLRI